MTINWLGCGRVESWWQTAGYEVARLRVLVQFEGEVST